MYIRSVFFFPLVLVGLLLAGALGTLLRQRVPALVSADHLSQFTGLQAAVLALLGLLLGFSFSMSVGRYDTRKNAEIAEANAIRTAFIRTSTLPAGVAAQERSMLQRYVQYRIDFYQAGTDWAAVARATDSSQQLQRLMFTVAQGEAGRDAVGNAVLASLTVLGETAETRQAAVENRIPAMAWVLLLTVALVASCLVGMGITRWSVLLLVIVPVVVAASLTLIWDLDSPRNGIVKVRQDSMHRVQQLVNAH